MNETSLAIFSRGAQLLAEANTIQKARDLKNLALTAADWARRVGAGEAAIQHAKAYAFDAEHRMGEMLAETERAKGTRAKGGTTGGPVLVPPANDAPTLDDLGITKNESSRAQKLAALPDETFEKVKRGEVPVSKAIKKKPGKIHVGPPADAMNFVENAILALEQIKPNDVQRKEAWVYLRRWLNEHE
jgi:hypothetical protein